MLAKVEVDGQGAGTLRAVEGKDGSRQVERLLSVAPEQHVYRYAMVATRMLIRDYVAELRAEDERDRTSTVIWSCEFKVACDDEAAMVGAIRGFFRAGLDNLCRRWDADQA